MQCTHPRAACSFQVQQRCNVGMLSLHAGKLNQWTCLPLPSVSDLGQIKATWVGSFQLLMGKCHARSEMVRVGPHWKTFPCRSTLIKESGCNQPSIHTSACTTHFHLILEILIDTASKYPKGSLQQTTWSMRRPDFGTLRRW